MVKQVTVHRALLFGRAANSQRKQRLREGKGYGRLPCRIVTHKKDYKNNGVERRIDDGAFIAPEGSVYADRDFMWRLSSATVELE